MIDLCKSIHIKKVNYVGTPCIIIPAFNGLRVKAFIDTETKLVRVFHKEKELKLGRTADQLRHWFVKYPRIVLDGVLSYQGLGKRSIKRLLKKGINNMNFYIIDIIPIGMAINATRRADVYRRIYDEYYIPNKKSYPNLFMVETYKASTSKQVTENTEKLFSRLYDTVYYRNIYHKYTDEPFKYNLIKTTKEYEQHKNSDRAEKG